MPYYICVNCVFTHVQLLRINPRGRRQNAPEVSGYLTLLDSPDKKEEEEEKADT